MSGDLRTMKGHTIYSFCARARHRHCLVGMADIPHLRALIAGKIEVVNALSFGNGVFQPRIMPPEPQISIHAPRMLPLVKRPKLLHIHLRMNLVSLRFARPRDEARAHGWVAISTEERLLQRGLSITEQRYVEPRQANTHAIGQKISGNKGASGTRQVQR